jgi:ribosomal protein S18 acetylase RimI-like enzyme
MLTLDRQMTASGSTYLRIPFELLGNSAVTELSLPPETTIRVAEDDDELIGLMARAFEISLDPRDRQLVEHHGARAVAAAMVRDATDGTAYQCERVWWSLVDWAGAPAGFVLPVVFTGCARDDVDEGTIYHIGVLPEFRGRGLGRILLKNCSNTLLRHGVWQISSDTAAENRPMIRLFELQGWTRHAPITVKDHLLPGLE